jgi:hypothetical protein
MSDVGYFSNMFHDFGDLSVELDDALNILVRSYRTEVSESEKKQAKKNLLALLTLILEDTGGSLPIRDQQIRQFLKDFMEGKSMTSQVEGIRKKIESDEKLFDSEINILDELISQISHQATVAFRRMRKVI